MRKAFCLVLLVATFGVMAHTAPVSPLKAQPQAEAPISSDAKVLDFRTGQFVAALSPVASGYYPDCSELDGAYCSTVGAHARCYWYQYSEPGFATCQSNHTWVIN